MTGCIYLKFLYNALLINFLRGVFVKKYIVKLTPEERANLDKMVKTGKSRAKKLVHARILLKADESEGQGWIDQDIAKAVDVSIRTIERIRQAFVEESLEVALNGVKRTSRGPTKMTGTVEAHLIALACSTPPEGYSYWTLKLLANGLVQAEVIDSISTETVRQTLKKTN
jgi:transposase